MNKKRVSLLGGTIIALLSIAGGCHTADQQIPKSSVAGEKISGNPAADKAKLVAGEVLRLPATAATKITDGAKLIDDPKAPGGKCIKLPARGRAWAVQWFFDSRLADNINYMVRIKLRADKESSEGSAISCGIYSVSRKVAPIHFSIDSKEMGDRDYRWVNCGNVYGREVPSAYLYLGKLVESAAKNIYIAEAEFIPEGAPGYKAHVRKNRLLWLKPRRW